MMVYKRKGNIEIYARRGTPPAFFCIRRFVPLSFPSIETQFASCASPFSSFDHKLETACHYYFFGRDWIATS